MLEIKTYSPDETFNIGTKLGKLFIEGDLICLEGPLGAGKTHITQGFANGLKIKDHVSSPTFNIIKEYHEGRIPLYHMDLYRLTEPEELIDRIRGIYLRKRDSSRVAIKHRACSLKKGL